MDQAVLRCAQARAPRYTSYPTAAQFGPEVGSDTAAGWLSAIPEGEAVSLYLHVPFCAQICWYCACNMKLGRRPEPLLAYADDLRAEIALVAAALGRRQRVVRVHWGGGTPTSLPFAAIEAIMAEVRARFDLAPDAEIAFELDPRNVPEGLPRRLAALGVGRVSLGVQEFDPKVQAAVNRIQPYDIVARVVETLRGAGIEAINFDLIYGLPHQSVETISETIRLTLGLAPSRIALFGYAHVPWMAKRQRMLPEQALPGAEERFAQATRAADMLVEGGYRRIGLDHFARPGDGLTRAAEEGRLVRNFQGYTDDPVETVIGMGATAISALPEGYHQNISETGAWARVVRGGRLPVARGVALTPEDRLRRAVILELMCAMEVDLGDLCAAHGRAPGALDAELAACLGFVEDGLARIEDRRLSVTERGRPALRVIAAAFDAHLAAAQATGPRHAVAV
ncbi:oxygen-independent coproporphyrinogen III oxidase [Paralimibaculum aggregatum]|uniref:Coproporphyrinogen-III oxidase n=1 Tax=Paralimibaculum aggregatum TaxID=3036245 RepID=A0ABQ6LJK0_9RHOB|nr:oxygen-independent coproporphyrinogen III oxidase [Limibaculum sp. NKW23]GMG81388.1 oxygen-independent coproporphyrinogen III oxidase [Limibaculum sp. NKW23]